MHTRRTSALAAVALVGAGAILLSTVGTHGQGDGWLSGTVTSAGAKIEGIVVSAKVPGETITTSVFTGADGSYFFPAMKPGHYRVWAQGAGFQRFETEIDLAAAVRRLDVSLKENADPLFGLSGYQVIEALPEQTPGHRRMKAMLIRNCTYCHEASTTLRDRFDERGWEAIVLAMSNGFSKTPKPLTPLQKELVGYLTEMRGPFPSPMKLRPHRPTGEATLPVVYEYDLPIDGGGYNIHEGSDWTYGPASTAGAGGGMHDAILDFNGNIWFTHTRESKTRTIGKLDTRTGKVTDFALPSGEGNRIARSHGIFRAHDGTLWFTAAVGKDIVTSILGRMDPKTEKIEGFRPPPGMMLIGGWVGEDAKGFIWASGGGFTPPFGALRFDPRTGEFREFRSPTQKGMTYGVTGDRHGNGWWMGIVDDVIGHSDITTGKVLETKLPMQPLTAFVKPGDIGEELPTAGVGGKQAPRRPRADHATDDVWIPNFYGNTLIRLNARTAELKYYPLPFAGMNPYETDVDSRHRVWMNFQNSDEIGVFDPATEKWTLYSWPTKGATQRQNTLLDRDGVIQIAGAFLNANRASRMVLRTPQEIQALRDRAR